MRLGLSQSHCQRGCQAAGIMGSREGRVHDPSDISMLTFPLC